MKIAFVVLHYENIEDTKECLNTLKKYISKGQTSVVVVDNGSKKEKLETIANQYINDQIIFLYSDDNLGFARGNNIGYIFAKKNLSADIIVLCNNDLIFRQDSFLDKIEEHYYEDKFDVAGPRIISLVDGKNQNPVPVQYKTILQINIRLLKFYILYLLSIFNLDSAAQKKIGKEIQEYLPAEQDDYQLFGACLILANNYVIRHEGICDKTFMYVEESILKEQVQRENLVMKYYEDVEVFHKEGSSTQNTYGRGKKKRQFYYKWNINGLRILKNIKRGGRVYTKESQ